MELDIIMEQQPVPLNRHHQVGVNVFRFAELIGMKSTYLPGRFPVTSARGNAYILVLYDYTTNAILATATKNP